MGRPSKLAEKGVKEALDKLILETPTAGSRRLSKLLQEKHGISVSHVTINNYINDKHNNKVQSLKVISNTQKTTTKIPEIEFRYLTENEIIDVNYIFTDNEKFLANVIHDPSEDIQNRLRAAAVRYMNATNYHTKISIGATSKEIEKFQTIISEMETEHKQNLSRIFDAIQKVVPEEMYAKIADVL